MEAFKMKKIKLFIAIFVLTLSIFAINQFNNMDQADPIKVAETDDGRIAIPFSSSLYTFEGFKM